MSNNFWNSFRNGFSFGMFCNFSNPFYSPFGGFGCFANPFMPMRNMFNSPYFSYISSVNYCSVFAPMPFMAPPMFNFMPTNQIIPSFNFNFNFQTPSADDFWKSTVAYQSQMDTFVSTTKKEDKTETPKSEPSKLESSQQETSKLNDETIQKKENTIVAKKAKKQTKITTDNKTNLTSTTQQKAPITYDAKQLKAKWSRKQPQLTDQFYNRVVEISKRIKCDPNDLMTVMNFETRKTFSPSEKYPGSTEATGLIQFTKTTAPDFGTTVEKLAKMTAVEQLDYVERYLVNRKSSNFNENHKLTEVELYLLVFNPGYVHSDIIARRGQDAYEKNKNLDVNSDGKITREDISKRLAPFRA